MNIPPAVAKPVVKLIELVGEKVAVALLKRLLNDSREAQLKTNYEAGKRIFKRKTKR